MSEIGDFFAGLVRHQDFQPLAASGPWTSLLKTLYLAGDVLVMSAFIALPVILWQVLKRQEQKFDWKRAYPLFVLLIVANAAVYLVDVIALWKPLYRVSALLKIGAGIATWLGIYKMTQWIPQLFALKTQDEFNIEIIRRQRVEEDLYRKTLQLEEAERTARLGYGYWDMVRKQVFLSEMAYHILSIPPGEMLSHSRLMDQIHPADMRFVEDSFSKNLKGPVFKEFYFRVITMQMEIRHVLIKGEVFRNDAGEPILVKGTIQDVSELRNHMLKVELQNKKLRKIAWLQSHRMRSPVATILGLTDLLNENDPSDPVNTEIIRNIRDLAHKLDTMIHEVDTLTRVKEKEDQRL